MVYLLTIQFIYLNSIVTYNIFEGIQTKTDGSSYEGNFIKDKKSGKGTYKSKESEVSCMN
jgi:hypothetical protein